MIHKFGIFVVKSFLTSYIPDISLFFLLDSSHVTDAEPEGKHDQTRNKFQQVYHWKLFQIVSELWNLGSFFFPIQVWFSASPRSLACHRHEVSPPNCAGASVPFDMIHESPRCTSSIDVALANQNLIIIQCKLSEFIGRFNCHVHCPKTPRCDIVWHRVTSVPRNEPRERPAEPKCDCSRSWDDVGYVEWHGRVLLLAGSRLNMMCIYIYEILWNMILLYSTK